MEMTSSTDSVAATSLPTVELDTNVTVREVNGLPVAIVPLAAYGEARCTCILAQRLLQSIRRT